MRLFAALPVDEGMRRSLTALQAQMREAGMKGRCVPPESFHITLAFIGEWERPEDVVRILEHMPFPERRLQLTGTGCFGRLWYAAFEADPELNRWVCRFRQELSDSGIPCDRKAFVPHITLMRKAEGTYAGPGEIPCRFMEAGRVSLMRSDPGHGGMVYTEIAGFPAVKG